MSIPAPARVAVIWDHAADLACAVAGRQLSRSQCAEMIFADYLSALGNETTAETAAVERDQRDRQLAELMWAMNHPPVRAAAPSVAAKGRNGAPGAQGGDAEARGVPSPERSTAVDWQVPDHKVPADCLVEGCADA